MTPPGPPASRVDTPAAAAVLGALLAMGTALTGWVRSNPADAPVPVVSEARQSVSRGVVDEVRAAAGAAAPQVSATPLQGRVAADAAGPLDINRADASTLAALPGIGPALARRIVEDRERRGAFRTPDDLLRVPGIGAQRYARLRDRIQTADAP